MLRANITPKSKSTPKNQTARRRRRVDDYEVAEAGLEEGHPDEDGQVIERLIEVGKERGYVTVDDILAAFPEAERGIDQLEEAHAALLAAVVAEREHVFEAEGGG